MKNKFEKMVVVLGLLLCWNSFVLCACTSDEELITYHDEQEIQEDEERILPVSEEAEVSQMQNVPAVEQEAEPTTIYIHVCGSVKEPGVYELPSGSRLFDAVNAAGGFEEEADADYMNQAEVLLDGMKVQIPTKEETEEWIKDGVTASLDNSLGSSYAAEANLSSNSVMGSSPSDGKVNINLADESALCSIRGIGQGRAKAIIAYREAHGSFSSIEDIMKVDGIKNATFEKLKDQICVK